MLIGTCALNGAYVTVAVELDEAERPYMVVEELERPGSCERRLELERPSFADAVHYAEQWLLARGGVLGAEAEGLAGSPVGRELAEAMFSEPHMSRFVHLPARPLAGG